MIGKESISGPLFIAVVAIGNAALAAANLQPRASTSFSLSSLQWQNCTTKEEMEAGLVCANLSVPLDWSKPNTETIILSMNMAKARDPASRIGYAIYNPGGPGDSAIADVTSYATGDDYIHPDILKHFDLSINPVLNIF